MRTPIEVAEERIGTKVGGYKLAAVLGIGGMGVVYEAVHDTLHQRVAVKVLARPIGDALALRRFENEARAASAVRHPGLVRVLDCGVMDDGSPYIVMDLVHGESLRVRMEHGPVSRDLALKVVAQLASALAVVHAHGIVHRDVKPENVMFAFDPEGGGLRVKLLDFGIARVPWEEGPVTREGLIVGTTFYMAPEQFISGDPITSAADIYALGVVLFELLSGVVPFSGTAYEVAEGHVHAEVPQEPLAMLPVDLAALVRDMMHKSPAERPTAASIRDRVSRVRVTPDPSVQVSVTAETMESARPVAGSKPAGLKTRPPRSFALVSVGLAALIVLVGAGFRFRAKPRPAVALAGMTRLAGGVFAMGHSVAELDADCARLGAQCIREKLDREQPPRRVHVSSFLLDTREVTNAQFRDVFESIKTEFEYTDDEETHAIRAVYEQSSHRLLLDADPEFGGIEIRRGHDFVVREGYADKPVVQVSWDAAQLYCEFVGKRLPTEAEYEFAARGVTNRRYPWGDEEPTCANVVFGRFDAGECPTLPKGAQPVSAEGGDRTPEGVYGLAGNVSEWVADAFLQPFYPDCGDCTNPVVPPGSSCCTEPHVFRGSSWSNNGMFARSSGRGRWGRQSVATAIGFRCALSAKD